MIEQGTVERVTGSRAIVRLESGRKMPVEFDTTPVKDDEVQVDTRQRRIVEPVA